MSVQDLEFKLNGIPTPQPLTGDEFKSLLALAVTTPSPKVPPLHLAKLVLLGYVAMEADGPRVTADGLVLITENP
jgi:hypothetical protein